MAKNTKSLSGEALLRVGEGFAIESTAMIATRADGAVVKKIGAKLDSAPAPDRRYVADIYSVIEAPGGHRLLFAQQKIGSDELRSLVVVHCSDSTTAKLLRGLRDLRIGNGSEPVGLESYGSGMFEEPVQIGLEPEQTVALKSNVAALGVAAEESAIDFYHISPFAMHSANKGGKLQINPVVRIELRTSQLHGLVRELVRMGVNPDVYGDDNEGL